MLPGGPSSKHPGFRILFVCFVLSGFASLLYQTIWMRLALARFGVNTSIVCTVLTVFMTGLALGTFFAGRWSERLERRFGFESLQLYAAAELLVGIGGWLVPTLFDEARQFLLALGPSDRGSYTLASATLLTAALLPFCTAMGFTFPTALAYLRRLAPDQAETHSFSYLYLPNVAGALLGVIIPCLVLIELFGFTTTLWGAASLNVVVAAIALLAPRPPAAALAAAARESIPESPPRPVSAIRLAALFLTGFSSMAMEVVWTRLYPPFVGTFVYSFGAILATYLLATTIGIVVYRRAIGSARAPDWRTAWWWLGPASILPLTSASHLLPIPGFLRIVLGLAPFCALLGYVTSAILDEEGGNRPERAANAYALNLLGCVLGPLLAGFVVIPELGTHTATLLFAAPLFLFALGAPIERARRAVPAIAWAGCSLLLWFWSPPFEGRFQKALVRHDHTATVAARGSGMNKRLFVNGVSMTHLSPITKMMVHFPMAHLDAVNIENANGIVVCLGMGTSFRSLLTWPTKATVVELVP
ncbi:MAG: hypothetical protein ACREQQ_12210, partial [Candidatus Binatia bacterium]